MASIRFKTYGKGVSNAPIYVRFSNGRNCNFEVKTELFIENSDYLKNGKTRRLAIYTDQLEFQKRLDKLETEIKRSISKTTDFNKDWLKGLVDAFHGKTPTHKGEPTILELIDKYCNHIVDSVDDKRQNSTRRTYNVTKMRIEKFQLFTGIEYKISQIDNSFKSDFIAWARNIENYKTSTLLKSVKQIKTVCRYAKRINFKVDESFIQESVSTEVKHKTRLKPVFLSIREINDLMSFQGSDYLTNARDWLVISCWTGCRVSDLMNLSLDNVVHTIKGEKAIRYTQQKTRITVNAPFHPDVERILNRNQGFPRPISDQKYNNYIKEVCRLVGIVEVIEGEKMNPNTKRKESGKFPKYELISSHIGRRSFSTNHYGKFPIEILMLVTGHKTVNQFLEYIGENPDSHISVLNQFYRQNQKELQPMTKTKLS